MKKERETNRGIDKICGGQEDNIKEEGRKDVKETGEEGIRDVEKEKRERRKGR